MSSSGTLFTYFILTGALHGFYLVIILLTTQSQKRNAVGWLLAIIIGAFSLYLFNAWVFRSGMETLNAYLSGTSMPFLYLVGPAYWLYIRFAIGDKTKWERLDVIHLVPAIVCFLAASPYYFMDCQVKLEHIAMMKSSNANLPIQRGFYFAGHLFQTLLYLSLSFKTVNTFRKSVQRQTREFKVLKDWITKTYSFMVTLTLIYLISFLGFIFFREGRAFFDRVFDITITGFIHLLGFWIIKDSPILVSSKQASLDEPFEEHEEIRMRIQKLMEKKPYLDSEYSLKTLSDQLSTNTVYASRMINLLFNQSFTDFINQLRVEEVKLRLANTPDEKLLAVALETGFSNKNTFIRVFKKYTHQTPSEYRDSLKKRSQ